MPSERDIGFEIRTLSNLIRRDVEKNIAAMDPKPNGRVHGWAINYFYENRDRDIFQKDFEEKVSISRFGLCELRGQNGECDQKNRRCSSCQRQLYYAEDDH